MPSINLETDNIVRLHQTDLCEITKNNYRIIKFTPVSKK